MKVIGEIYETYDYDNFYCLPDNRDVLSTRLNKLIASISERYVLNPILVNGKMQIIDGQGRYEARKHLGLPIHFIMDKTATSDDCRRMNKYNTKWTSLDFAKSHAKAKKKAYQLLLNACERTKLSIGKVLRLANHGSGSDDRVKMSAFERGDLKFTEEDFDTAIRVSQLVSEVVDALQFEGKLNDAFWVAAKVMFETKGYSHEKMLKNCRSLRSTYAQMARLADQLVEFERIYNYRAAAKNKLYFSDYLRNKGANVRDYTNTTMTQYKDTNVSTLKGSAEKL